MRTIIVDDHILFRQGLVSLLQSEPDFEVVGEAGSNQEALRLAQQLKPDLILMDFELPDGSGVQSTKEILQDFPECKIVFLTVYETDEKLIDSVRSGAVGYLLKSMPINDLLAYLRLVPKGEAAISRSMILRIMEELACPGCEQSGENDALTSLSKREKDILRELMDGASNREISTNLFISQNTVKHHIHNILAKLGLSSRRAAADLARKHGLK